MAGGEADEVKGLASAAQGGESGPDEEGDHEVLVPEWIDDLVDRFSDFGDEDGDCEEAEGAVDGAVGAGVRRGGEEEGRRKSQQGRLQDFDGAVLTGETLFPREPGRKEDEDGSQSHEERNDD